MLKETEVLDFETKAEGPEIDITDGILPVTRTEAGVKEMTDAAVFGAGEGLDPAQTAYDYREGNDDAVDARAHLVERRVVESAERSLLEDMLENNDPELNIVVEGLSYTTEIPQKGSARRLYSKKVADSVVGNSESFNEMYDQGKVDGADGYAKAIEKYTEKTAAMREVFDEVSARWESKSLPGKIGSGAISVLSSVILLPSIWRNSAVDDAPTSSILPGTNVREQAEYLFSLEDPEEIKAKFKEAVDEVSGLSVYEGRAYAAAIMDYTRSDEFWDNAWGVIDAAALIPVGKIVTTVGKVGKAATKSVMRHGPDVEKVSQDLGRNAESAIAHVTSESPEKLINPRPEKLEPLVPSIMNPEKIMGPVRNSASAAKNKLQQAAIHRGELLDKIMSRVRGAEVKAALDQELAVLARNMIEDLRRTHTGIGDSISDIQPYTPKGPDFGRNEFLEGSKQKDNVDRVRVVFGTTTGEKFKSKASAEKWRRRYLPDLTDAKVEQSGDFWDINYDAVIKTTGEIERLSLDAASKTPARNFLSRWTRSQGSLLSDEMVKDRRKVSDFYEKAREVFQEVGKPIHDLGRVPVIGKRRVRELDDAIQHLYDHPDPDTGEFIWKTLDEMEELFMSLHGKKMTEGQKDAYVASVQMNQAIRFMEAATITKAQMRAGVVKWKVAGIEEEFLGVSVREIPWNREGRYFNVAYVNSDGKVLYVKSGITGADDRARKYLDELVEKGAHVIQTYNGPMKLPGKKKTATFIVTNKTSQRGLNVLDNYVDKPVNLTRRSPFYIKQGVFKGNSEGTRRYRGDRSIWSVASRAEGEEVIKHLEEVRRLKHAGDDVAASKYMSTHLPEMTDEMWEGIDTGARFGVTRVGEDLVSSGVYKNGVDFVPDEVRPNPWNIESQISKFNDTGMDMKSLRSETDTLVRVEKAATLSPLLSLQNSMSRAFTERTMADFTEKAMNRFWQEFGEDIAVSRAEFFNNPFGVMSDPDIIKGRRAPAMKQYINGLTHFLSMPTQTSKYLNRVKSEAYDYILGKTGTEGSVGRWLDEKRLAMESDPVSFFRGVAFHTKMGVFNPKHLFLQSTSVAMAFAYGGRHAIVASAAVPLAYGLRLGSTPARMKRAGEIIENAGKYMPKNMRWTADEFIESQTLMSETGWDVIGGSVAVRDAVETPSFVKGATSRVLDRGLDFFKKGEQISRVVAWHTAYRMVKNKTKGALKEQDIDEIRMMANDMTANMTRDMNAAFQHGPTSMATQFWGYQFRIAEQMLFGGRGGQFITGKGGSLTPVQRMRMGMVFSTLYGVPVGFGSALFPLWPIHEEVKGAVAEMGMSPGDEGYNPMVHLLTSGIVSAGTHMAFGGGFDTSAYGPAGNPIIKELMKSEKDSFDLLGGAGASISASMAAGAFKIMRASWDWANQGEDFKPTPEDILEYASSLEVASLSSAVKAIRGVSLGVYVTRNNYIQGEVSVTESILSAITGLTPEKFSEAFIKKEAMDEFKTDKRGALKDAEGEYRKARLAAMNGDWAAMERHHARAKLILASVAATPRESHDSWYRGAMSKDFLDSVEFDWITDYKVWKQQADKNQERLNQ